MSSKDFGGYKRLVQYFWDPEPKNDDPLHSPIWCLGRRYDSSSCVASSVSTSNHQQPANNQILTTQQEDPRGKSDTSESILANGESNPHSKSNGARGEERGWPPEFLDDFESRIWLTYRSGFPTIRRSDDPDTSVSITFAVRLRSQLVDQGGFSSDTGWGCMIRSGQSLLANTLVISRLGRGRGFFFLVGQASNSTAEWRRGLHHLEERALLSLFADDPYAPFSIHRFVDHGAVACGKHPGEWFGPSATARCIQ